ncbi:MAG: bifunctional anthranilate synthase component I family protein/class IV aminotransferase [Magnetococcales bacterium]|nr:bifunctional anthranilate synthase component I family protein/class IV aminotransferase [Magnetococcales bacterium]
MPDIMDNARLDSGRLNRETCLMVDFVEFGRPLFFSHPVEILTAWKPPEIDHLLERLERASGSEALWAAGFIGYEAAAAFGLPVMENSTLDGAASAGEPLAWFALFNKPHTAQFPELPSPPALDAPQLMLSQTRYRDDLAAIHRLILDGESYQVNYTASSRFPQDATPLSERFLALHLRHRFPYSAWIRWHDEARGCGGSIASFSPELFLSRRGDQLTTAPIKGTRPRGTTLEEDLRLRGELIASQKERAEHVMIVDMARNDLGRICRIGSVTAPRQATPRPFPTVYHLESRVSGQLRPGIDLGGIFEALFPAASITGAPKHRTMEIIRHLERRRRGIYCGSIGVIKPGGDFVFNVAIRTAAHPDGELSQLGLGGGIVADSSWQAEYQELATKGRFMQTATKHPAPALIETGLMEADGRFPLLGAHLARMAASAQALGYPFDPKTTEAQIRATITQLQRTGPRPAVIRWTLAPGGVVHLTHRAHLDPKQTVTVRISPQRVDRNDRFLAHKSSRREIFNRAWADAQEAGYDEALFLNHEGDVTEGCLRALLVRIGKAWFAPPLKDGLLPSLWRGQQMKHLRAKERSLGLEDLAAADEIRMGNAVQGTAQVVQLDNEDGATPLFATKNRS